MLKTKLPVNMVIRPPKTFNVAVSIKKYFLKDPNADLLINLQSKIFPVHRYQLRTIPFFQRVPKNQKILFINEEINVQIFQRILGFFYGEPITIESLNELEECLLISCYLQTGLIQEQIQKKLLTKPFKSQIQIFILLQIAYRYDLPQLLKNSMKSLQEEEFEPINYNKFDFIYIQFTLFQIVIRRHHRMKKIDKIIKGIKDTTIEEVIKLYCRVHKFSPQTQAKLIAKYINHKQKQGSYDVNSPAIVQHRQNQKKNARDQNNSHKNQQKRRKRKYSQNIEIVRTESSISQPIKIHTSGKIGNTITQEKITQQIDEENCLREEVESPVIRISPTHDKIPKIQENKKEGQGFSLLKVPFLKNDEEKESAFDDPEQLIGKVSKLLDHYKSAYQLHESNMFTIKKRFNNPSLDTNQNRRFSAGPNEKPILNKKLGFNARLANTIGITQAKK